MKKVSVLFLSLTLLLGCLFIPAAAAGDGQIGVVASYAAPGDTVTFPVRYQGNPSFWIMFLKIKYNPEVLEYVGTSRGDFSDLNVAPTSQGGILVLDLEGSKMQDITGDGVLCKVTFRIRESAPGGKQTLSLFYEKGMICNYEEQYVRPACSDISLTVTCKEHRFGTEKVEENGKSYLVCEDCGARKEVGTAGDDPVSVVDRDTGAPVPDNREIETVTTLPPATHQGPGESSDPSDTASNGESSAASGSDSAVSSPDSASPSPAKPAGLPVWSWIIIGVVLLGGIAGGAAVFFGNRRKKSGNPDEEKKG